MPASILASGVTPQETRTFLLRSLPALFIGTDAPVVWVRDSTNPSLSFFVAKSPEDTLQWIRQSYRPEVFPQLNPEPKRGHEPINPDDAIPDSQPQSEDDSNYGSPVRFQSIADSPRDTSDESAGRGDKRPMSNASSSQPPAKRARDRTAAPEPEYTITVGNVNRRKERERRKRLENTLSDVFVTEEEDNVQDAYVRENGTKLAWLARQPDCMGIGRQEASALVYRASAIASGEAIENLKTVLAHWRKNRTMDLNRQTASSQSLVTFTSTSQNINTALSGFRKAFFNFTTIKATGIL